MGAVLEALVKTSDPKFERYQKKNNPLFDQFSNLLEKYCLFIYLFLISLKILFIYYF